MRLKLDSLKDEVLEMFDSGIRPAQIAKQLNVNLQPVTNLIKHYKPNITFTVNKGNTHYFDIIDSYSKAYIVGFIAADGSIVKTKTTTSLTITIKYEDKAVLEFIKSEIGSEHKLTEIKRPSSFDKNKMTHHIRYCVSDKNITSALINLGITYHKSLTMGNIIENIPYQYRDAFIIGYFDGDGSVTCREGLHKNSRGNLVNIYTLLIQIRGTRAFLEGICNHLDIDKNLIKQYDSIPSLRFKNKKNVLRLFKCYENLKFYYKRKYDVFLKRINHPSYDKYKQDQTISSSTE